MLKPMGMLAFGSVLFVLALAVVLFVNSVNLLTPGVDGDSTNTSSASGLELINSNITILRGCDEADAVRWNEAADLWLCSPTVISGTSEITGATSVVVAHTLATTPTFGDCWFIGSENPTTDVGTLFVDTFTATNMTLNVEVDPGASGFDVDWFCRLR